MDCGYGGASSRRTALHRRVHEQQAQKRARRHAIETCAVALQAHWRKFMTEEQKQILKHKLAREHQLLASPQLDDLFEIAWDLGCAWGEAIVAQHFETLVPLVTGYEELRRAYDELAHSYYRAAEAQLTTLEYVAGLKRSSKVERGRHKTLAEGMLHTAARLEVPVPADCPRLSDEFVALKREENPSDSLTDEPNARGVTHDAVLDGED